MFLQKLFKSFTLRISQTLIPTKIESSWILPKINFRCLQNCFIVGKNKKKLFRIFLRKLILVKSTCVSLCIFVIIIFWLLIFLIFLFLLKTFRVSWRYFWNISINITKFFNLNWTWPRHKWKKAEIRL